jgi:hypothetical protein
MKSISAVKTAVIAASLCAAFCISGCREKNENGIPLDDSNPLALAPDVSWAVVLDPYAAYRGETSWEASVTGHCRKGDILQVLGMSAAENGETWYRFDEGWLPDSAVSVYSNRYRAETAAKQVK